MITIGLLIAAVIVNATKDMNGAQSYRIPIGLQFIWAASKSLGERCVGDRSLILICRKFSPLDLLSFPSRLATSS